MESSTLLLQPSIFEWEISVDTTFSEVSGEASTIEVTIRLHQPEGFRYWWSNTIVATTLSGVPAV